VRIVGRWKEKVYWSSDTSSDDDAGAGLDNPNRSSEKFGGRVKTVFLQSLGFSIVYDEIGGMGRLV
jgi:hypothetical protein